MNFVALFIQRRVLAYMLSAALLLFGFIGLSGVGLDRLPNVEPPMIAITTINSGASPEVMDASVSSVIESAVNSIAGIENIESTSSPGVSQVWVQFIFSKNTDVAFNEVQAKINQVINDLPREVETPIVVKMDLNAAPIVWLVLKGDRPLSELNQLARTRIKRQLENINGVGGVSVGGGRERKIRVDLDLQRLSSLGISAQQVIAAFSREHIQLPGGYLVGDMQEKMLHLDLEFHSTAELAQLVVVWREQVPVTLGDIADISDGLDDKRGLARFNGDDVLAIAVRKVSNANTVKIVDELKRRLDEVIVPALPDGVELLVAKDESSIISGTANALKNHIVEGTLLAAFVVWLFLLNLPATLIITAAIPVSLAGAVVVMFFGGYTFNIMTLSGLLLLIGVVVDDAIVVLENIHRHLEAGDTDRIRAATNGTREVVFAVLAASLTLVCIFATVIFMEGMVGIFMRSFAVVVSGGVITSLFVSLSLTPALCARFLSHSDVESRAIVKWISRLHQQMDKAYSRLLAFSLKHRITVLAATALLVASTGWFMGQLGSEFFPEDDESRFSLTLKAPLGSSIDYIEQKIGDMEMILNDIPEVTRVLSTVGSGQGSEVNEAQLNVILLGKEQRSRSQSAIMQQVRTAAGDVIGVQAYVNVYPMFGANSGEPFNAYITGPDLYRVAELAEQFMQRLKNDPRMGDVRMELKLDRPQLYFDVDRNRAQALGISTQQIGDTVRVLAGGADIAKYNALPGDGERYDIRLAAKREGMRAQRDIENVYLQGPEGGLIPLDAVVQVEESLGPATVERRDLNFGANFSSTPAVDLGQAVEIFQGLGDELLPPGYQVALAGQAQELGKSANAILFVFATGLILVYMVLASQFNSFLQPVLVMLAQPLAIVGGIIALWLVGHTLNIYSMIGMVLLVGLVSKNSILLVDLINRYRAEGMDTMTAISQACPRRMRPVMMTSLTIVLAMLPAAIGVGEGAGQYGPLAVAVVGGVISSTLLTLIVVPVAYSMLERWLAVK
ncbi:efflux RND transporter permease subunit [Halioglobus maricola]|uniref:Efflux RND transporter permease subunit n=1 Tax=Halioglobus maricola TaxID=2601894 RepID=A0A5P9NN44_9GAMM|nr:efflux RND transporter permease subunit [Halioglobus maricola]QFU77182.1 efflux RND transporter permease subunit [Halioglobus maricola]